MVVSIILASLYSSMATGTVATMNHSAANVSEGLDEKIMNTVTE